MKHFIILLLSLLLSVFCQAKDDVIVKKKTYSKVFSINDNTVIKVGNSYGDITYETWNQNKVSYYIEVIVDGRSETNVSKKLSQISVDFSSGNGYTSAQTNFKNQSIKGVNIKINYIVKLPKNNPIDISLNYGDIFLPTLSGEISIQMNYGEINASGNVDNLSISSNYSDANLLKVNDLKIRSNYGDFSIKNINNLNFSGNYSDLVIQNLNKDLTLKGNYNELELLSISSSSRNITLSGNYQDYEIHANASSKIKIEGMYTDVTYSSKYNVINNKKKYSKLSFEAQTSSSSNCIIQISGTYSDINLK